ncbi:MAG: excinuclease ABC subunit UvrA [Verrucomicrobiota bacterium]|nr:excinuclease ABC subunit UvrA [Limisphaera sp.]MDW8382263.1 excinuclease ABC subunit UvrA [Verrucomicrobiota bacterium]
MNRSNSMPPIRLRGARQNNLKGFDLDLPQHQLIVITGLSGSGKSSLAFDTLYAEGQRRYIETFSPYARQFFDRMDKPAVDQIENIPPAIALEQCNTVRTTRSTVGTLTEICDYMKLLWPHLATLYCSGCAQAVLNDTPIRIWDALQPHLTSHADSELVITFDLPLSNRMTMEESLQWVQRQGYQRLWWQDRIMDLEAFTAHLAAAACRPAHLTIVQDRMRPGPSVRARFLEACEQAYYFGHGQLMVRLASRPRDPSAAWTVHKLLPFSQGRHCPRCNLTFPPPSPAQFSFNHPLGACPQCKGFGRIITIDYRRAIPDPRRSLAQGAIRPWQSGAGRECQRDLLQMCRTLGIPTNIPFAQLKPEWQQWILEGDPDYGKDEDHQWPRAWYGLRGYFRWLETRAYKMHVRVLLSRYRAYAPCPACNGTRFQAHTLLYRLIPPNNPMNMPISLLPDAVHSQSRPALPGLSLADFYHLPIRDALALMEQIAHQHRSHKHDPITVALEEVLARLRYLEEVGLGYLTLDRPTRTLSGGETERVNLTACLGSLLVNTLFVLDEPSVGLHPRDTDRLIRILQRLRDAGNTVVVVEHEPAIIRAADHLVELGPGRGAEGGHLVFQGTYRQMLRAKKSITGQYLAGQRSISIPTRRPVLTGQTLSPAPSSSRVPGPDPACNPDDNLGSLPSRGQTFWLTLRHAQRHNLQDLTVHFPLRRFVCITGVSGSGKTTLIREVLVPALARHLPAANGSSQTNEWQPDSLEDDPTQDTENPVTLEATRPILEGWEQLRGWAWVDQSPLGRTPRSNPAVYTGAFEPIRELFASSPQARAGSYKPAAFSFNSQAGQCERCRGAGFEKVEMQFLSDVYIRCPECRGRRYRPEILNIKVAPPHLPESLGRSSAWSIADLLEATVQEVIEWLRGFGKVKPALQALHALELLQAVGLGYLRLGQPLNTLSGGESQRLKLVRHLADLPNLTASAGADLQPNSRGLLLLFDEPTTGLHFDDVRILLETFQRLVDAGHSLIVIEHNLEVIKCADWIIDLGPEAGDQGGRIVATGTPEMVAACKESYTGRALQPVLQATDIPPKTLSRIRRPSA